MNYFAELHSRLTLGETALEEVPLVALPPVLVKAIADHYRHQLQELDSDCLVTSGALVITRRKPEGGDEKR